MQKKIGLLVGVSACLLLTTSCRFGHTAEEIRNKYNDVERDLTFSFIAPGPGGTTTRVTLTDDELEGVTSRWEPEDRIALFDFGEVFVATGGGSVNYALPLIYEEDAPDITGIDFARFRGWARAKMGEDVFNSKMFALLYPYKKFQDQPCSTTSVTLSFDGQYGTLPSLQENFLYAWGCAQGVCEDDVVTLSEGQSSCSSRLPWHPHEYNSEDIILDNKMCIIRFSMVVALETIGQDNLPDTTFMTLKEFLGSNLVVDRIEVQNMNNAVSGISESELDLHSGLITATAQARNVISVVANADSGAVTLKEIQQQDATPVNHSVNADSVAWGSTFYLAVPCPDDTQLEFHPMLSVHTRNVLTGLPGPTYYGSVSNKTIKEGDYYMTAPIIMSDSKAKLDVEAKIYLYYHSSYVWDQPIDVY